MKKFRRNGKKIGLIFVLVFLVMIGSLLLFINNRTYEAMEEATVLLEDERVTQEDDWILVEPEQVSGNVVLYQGGLVETEAYLPLAVYLSDNGIRVIMPTMPFNLAILDVDIFEEIYDAYESDLPWWIGGHSLGGTASAMYAADNVDKLEGILLLASYPSENTDLSALELTVLSISASNDEIVSQENYENTLSLLPHDTSFVTIEGGNHSQFGYYGFQDGDGESTLTQEEQIQQIGEAILSFINEE